MICTTYDSMSTTALFGRLWTCYSGLTAKNRLCISMGWRRQLWKTKKFRQTPPTTTTKHMMVPVAGSKVKALLWLQSPPKMLRSKAPYPHFRGTCVGYPQSQQTLCLASRLDSHTFQALNKKCKLQIRLVFEEQICTFVCLLLQDTTRPHFFLHLFVH